MGNEECKEKFQLLSFLIDKELNKEEEVLVKEHIANCSECSKEYAELVELKTLMEEINKEELEAPEGFTESVMSKIEEEKPSLKNEGKIYNFIKPFFEKPWVPAVIAAMLLVVMYIPGSLGPLMYSKDAPRDAPREEMNDGVQYTSDLGNNVSRSLEDTQESKAEAPTAGEQVSGGKAIGENRKIIRNGFVSAEVTSYENTEKEIIGETENLGGYVSGSNSYFYGEKQDLLMGNINIRIPENNFDQMMSFLESKGRTLSKNTSSNDVTEEFFDTNTRINNLRIKEERLLEILSKQGELKDLLAVENEIAQTRSEIESMEGRLKLLSGQIAFSGIEVNLREVRNLDDSISKDSVSGIGTKIKESIIKSINMILDLGVKGIIFISSALPFLLILIILYFVSRFIWNKKNRDL